MATKKEEIGDSGVVVGEITIDRAKSNLHQRLAAVRDNVSFLKKENQGYSFKYVSSSQTLLALRNKMGEAGVLLVPSMTQVECADFTTAKGKHEWITRVWFDMTWVNVDKPEEREVSKWFAFGSADGEQGVGIAATYAEKTFLLKFFNIPTDEQDPDHADNQQRRAESQGAPATKTAAKPAPATQAKKSEPAAQTESKASETKPAPAATASTPPTPPKYIEIVLNSPKHNAILKAYMVFQKKDKATMKAQLASLWDAQNHDEKAYLVAVEKDLTVAGEGTDTSDLPF